MELRDAELWRELGQQLRVDAVRPAAQAGSGHPSGMSAADLMAVLISNHLRYDFANPRDPHNDRIVFSKGHASTLLYAMFRAAGAISDEELLSYRRFDSVFDGHPTPRIPWVDVATGSLGQGLPYAVGMALAGKRLDRLPFRIDHAYAAAVEMQGKPVVIVARTLKGKGAKRVEDKNGYHGKALDNPDEVIKELGGVRRIRVEPAMPDTSEPRHEFATEGTIQLPAYDLGEEVATRRAYGDALAAVGKVRSDVVALDGEVANSTYAETFRDELPDRYFEMYIAEQQMVAAAVGMQVLGWRPFASTFAAFLSRAYDFIRMSAISGANYCLCSEDRRQRWDRLSPDAPTVDAGHLWPR
jgi:transketolase